MDYRQLNSVLDEVFKDLDYPAPPSSFKPPPSRPITPTWVDQNSVAVQPKPISADWLEQNSMAVLDEPNAIARGLERSVTESSPRMLAETIEGIGLLTDSPDLVDTYSKALREMADRAEVPERKQPTFSSIFQREDDFWDTLDRAGTYAGESLGEGLGSTLPSIIGGVGMSLAGRRVAGRPGQIGGAVLGAATPAAALNYGDLYSAMKEEGVEPRRAAELAAWGTGPITALDVGGVGGILSRLTGTARHNFSRFIARRIIAEAGKGAAREGLTEASQQAIQEAMLAKETDTDFFTAERFGNIGEAGLTGALVGGALGGPAGIVPDRPRAPARADRDIPASQPQPEPAPPPAGPPAAPDTLVEFPGTGQRVTRSDLEEAGLAQPQPAPPLELSSVEPRPEAPAGPLDVPAPPPVTPEIERASQLLRDYGFPEEQIQDFQRDPGAFQEDLEAALAARGEMSNVVQPPEGVADSVVADTESAPDLSQRQALPIEGEARGDIPSVTPLSATGDIASLEGTENRSVGQAQLQRNLLEIQTSLLNEGYGSLDRDARALVDEGVFRTIQDSEIFRPVIASVPIDVVDMLVSEQFPLDRLLNDSAVFKDAFASNDNLAVRGRVIDAIVSSPAFPIAEGFPVDAAQGAMETGRATEAGDGRHDQEFTTQKVMGQAEASLGEPVPGVQVGPAETEVADLDRFSDVVEPALLPEQPKPRRAPRKRTAATLIGFLKSRGGIVDTNGDLRARDFHRMPGLVTTTGMDPDKALEVAKEYGFLPEDAGPDDLIAAIDQRVRIDQAEEREQARKTEEDNERYREEARAILSEGGLDPKALPDAVDAVGTMIAGGMDPYDAVERWATSDPVPPGEDVVSDESEIPEPTDDANDGGFPQTAQAGPSEGGERGGERAGEEPAPAEGEGRPGRDQPADEAGEGAAGVEPSFPGTEPISDAELAQRKADAGLRAGADQKPADVGLFGDERNQMDLVDEARRTETPVKPEPAEPETDDFDAAFDSALDEEFGEPESKAPRTVGEAATSAVRNVGMGLGDVAKGLDELFNPKNKLGAGPTFDEDTYRAALPYFQAGAQHFTEAGSDVSDMVRALIRTLARDYNMSREVIDRMRPYVRRFIEDVRAGKQALASSPADETGTELTIEPIVSAFRERLLDPKGGFRSIIEARQFAKEHGFEAKAGTPEVKLLEEKIELAAVLAARRIVRQGGSPADIFQSLVDLYSRQPKLSARTSKSIADQAYSTPSPLAYIASRLAGVADANLVYEPTAGNGMLLIEADPQNVIPNELDDTRADNLRAQGFARTIQKDATDPGIVTGIKNVEGGADVVIANPPFGATGKRFTVGDLETGEIDHAISLEALKAMHSKGGRAVLIVGGPSKLVGTEEGRSDAYNGRAKREFFYNLYKEYNVTDHFTVAGELYERQGAGWPVDVIVINGRGKSQRDLPAADPPKIYASWDALKEKLDEPASVSAPSDEGAAKAPGREPGSPERDGRDRREVVRDGPDLGEPEPGIDRGVLDAGIGEQPDADRQPAGVQPEPPAPGPELERDRGRPDQPASVEKETEQQASYSPASSRSAIGTLVPRNMQAPVRESLAKVQAKVGDIDTFVADRLGYTIEELEEALSAEQVDAVALALDNMDKNAAFVIGDQTGVGKGRVVAAAIRYAIRQNATPVFVTAKPNLYSDMMRDLEDVNLHGMLGHDIRVLMTNHGETIDIDDAGKRQLKSQAKAKHEAELQELMGGLDGRYDVVFTTYDQMQTIKGGQDTVRRSFLRSLVYNSEVFLIFDESHNAGGQKKQGWEKKGAAPDRATLARELAAAAKAVMFSSATYAKRPDVMDLYARTDMSMAVPTPDALGEAISKGGVPMQQSVATMLAEAGQYMRRERSFDGVRYDTPVVEVDTKAYADFANSLHAVYTLSEMHVRGAVKRMDKKLKQEAKALSPDGSTGGAGADSTNFTAVMHNVISQMLLSLKADAAADRAIEAIKNGEKPVVALANTNESFINSYADLVGLTPGDAMNITFSNILLRYLERSREIRLRGPDRGVQKMYLSDEVLGEAGVAAYESAKKMIEGADLGRLPVSPIDHIHMRLKQAGYKTGEITGRTGTIDYTGKTPIYTNRPAAARTANGKRQTITKFNNGQMDAVILNQSGSTGLSLHASEKFKDQRPRHMIIAQAELNIDTHMQMLGRIHRTGQVTLPRYSQIIANVAAEKRPAAILSRKMASLNANTTADTKSAVTATDVVDIMNEYGDLTVKMLMDDNPDIHAKLGGPLKTAESGIGFEKEGAARKVTGRIPMMPPAEQDRLYNWIESEYQEMLAAADAAGENTLEAKRLPFDARTIETTEVVARKGTSDSPFADGVTIEKVSVKRLGKPYTPAQVIERLGKALGAEVATGEPATAYENLADVIINKTTATSEDTIDRFRAHKTEVVSEIENEERAAAQRDRLEGLRRRWEDTHGLVHSGGRVTLKNDVANFSGFVIDVKQTGSPKNPVALGSWKATIAIPDASRQVVVPFSRLYPPGHTAPDDTTVFEVEGPSRLDSIEQSFALFERGQTEVREERFIATGNMLAAYDWVNHKGQIINYTTDTGDVRPGILLRRGFDVEAFHGAKPVTLSPDEVMRFLTGVYASDVRSTDRAVQVGFRYGSEYFVEIAASKNKGGRYFLDSRVRGATSDELTKVGSTMRFTTSDQSQFRKVVEALNLAGAVFEVRADEDKARARGIVEETTPVASARLTPQAQRQERQIKERAAEIVRRITGGEAITVFWDQIRMPDAKTAAASGATGEEFAAGMYRPARGVSGRALVELALDEPATSVLTTAGHESWHHVEFSGLLTDQERGLLSRELPRLRPIAAYELGINVSETTNMPAYEINAYAFAQHRRLAEEGRGQPGVHVGVLRIFRRIHELLRRIANMLRGLGFQTSEDVFERARTGEAAARRQRTEATPPSQAASARPRPHRILSGSPAQRFLEERHANLLKNYTDLTRKKLQDTMIPVKRLEQAIERARGVPLPEGVRAYLAESLFSGRLGVRLDRLYRDKMKPLSEEIANRGVQLAAFDDYLIAKTAPYRNAKIAERNPKMPDGGAGAFSDGTRATNANAEALIQRARDEGRIADFETIETMVRAIINETRNVLYRAGLINRETYDQWGEDEFYVPLRGGEAFTEESGLQPGKGYDVRGREAEMALGRESAADSPLAFVFLQAENALIRAEKNRVAKAFFNFVVKYADDLGDQFVVKTGEVKRRYNPATGEVEGVFDNRTFKLADNVISVKIGGKEKYIEIADPRVASAMKKMGAMEMAFFVRGLHRFNRYLSTINTALDPEFVFRNFVRDLETAMVHLSEEDVPKMRKAVLRDLPKAISGSWAGLAGKYNSSEWAGWFKEFEEDGGKISFFNYESLETIKGKIANDIRRMQDPRWWDTPDKWRRNVADAIGIVNMGVENGVRLSTYVNARRMGQTRAQAASLARELTVNFNRRGDWGPILNASYLFYNAATQGTVRMATAFAKSKRVRRIVYGMMAAGFALDFINRMSSGDDDDKRNLWDKIPDYEKERNLVIMAPKGLRDWLGLDETKPLVKFPLAYGYNLPVYVGMAAGKLIHDREYTTGRAAVDLAGATMQAFMPINMFDSWTSLVPTAPRMAMDPIINRDWLGRPLYPDYDWDKFKPTSEKAWPWTPDWIKGASRWLNETTGGDAGEAGFISVNPEVAEYYADQLTGGLGRFVNRAISTSQMVFGYDDWQPHRVPFVRVFYGEKTEFVDSMLYREIRDQVDAANYSIKNGPRETRQEKRRQYADEIAVTGVFDEADKQLRSLSKQWTAIENNAELSEDERQKRIDRIRERRRQVMARARKTWYERRAK